MIRFLSFLLNKPYEPCKSCETLKQQLEFERSEKKELLDTILRIVNPKVVESEPVRELTPIVNTTGLFSRRRAALEARDRHEAQILAQSKNVAKPDITESIEQLENELGLDTERSEVK